MPRSGPANKAAKLFKAQCKLLPVVHCYFCGDPIDMDLNHRDRWSFTTQHITPISRGGSETDPENMAPAHRRCNSQEGNRLAGTKPGTDGDMTMGPKLRQSRVW